MAYNWKEQADKAGNNSETLPEGTHRVRISRILTAKKDGSHMADRDGNRTVMVILSDNQERQALASFALGTSKGDAHFCRLLLASRTNTDVLDKAGVTPVKFFDPKWANKLVGKQLDVECKHNQADNGRTYANVYPIMPQGDKVEESQAEPAQEFDPEADLTDDDRAALAANAAATDDIPI